MFEIGSSLRDARLRQGLELAELEAETKIRAKYLRALEEERFEVLPGDTYVKGFLRIYAERLGLDGQLYVDEYNSRFADAEEPVLATGARRHGRRGRFETHAVLIALAAIVAVTVLVIAAWRIGDSGGDGPAEVTTGAASAAQTVPAQTAPAATTGAAPDALPVNLVVLARGGPSAIEVRRNGPAGELLYAGTLRKGERVRFSGSQLWLVVGKPQNVRVNGEPVEAPAGEPATLLVTTAGVRLDG